MYVALVPAGSLPYLPLLTSYLEKSIQVSFILLLVARRSLEARIDVPQPISRPEVGSLLSRYWVMDLRKGSGLQIHS